MSTAEKHYLRAKSKFEDLAKGANFAPPQRVKLKGLLIFFLLQAPLASEAAEAKADTLAAALAGLLNQSLRDPLRDELSKTTRSPFESEDSGSSANSVEMGLIEKRFFDPDDLLQKSHESGTAFGAVIQGHAPIALDNIAKAFNDDPTALQKVLNAIPTFRSFEIKEKTARGGIADLTIKVPVLSDIQVRVELVLEGTKDFAFLKWTQKDPTSQLASTDGYVLVRPISNDQVWIETRGSHVLKPEHRIAWALRPAAKSFAVQHYLGFFSALQKVFRKTR